MHTQLKKDQRIQIMKSSNSISRISVPFFNIPINIIMSDLNQVGTFCQLTYFSWLSYIAISHSFIRTQINDLFSFFFLKSAVFCTMNVECIKSYIVCSELVQIEAQERRCEKTCFTYICRHVALCIMISAILVSFIKMCGICHCCCLTI